LNPFFVHFVRCFRQRLIGLIRKLTLQRRELRFLLLGNVLFQIDPELAPDHCATLNSYIPPSAPVSTHPKSTLYPRENRCQMPKPRRRGSMAKEEKFAEKATDAMKNAGKSIQEAASKAGDNASALNAKVIDHVEENTRAAFNALRTAASVKSVQELAQIQSEFVKAAAARSQAQIKEVSDMIVQFGKDAMTMFQPKKD
jgi:hypothetical protein